MQQPDRGVQAQLVAAIWQRPSIPDQDIPLALEIPAALWNGLKAEGDTPPLFTIGRRLFVKTEDLRAWLNEKAKAGTPGSRRLRQQAAA